VTDRLPEDDPYPNPPWEAEDPAWPVRAVETDWETPYCEGGYDTVERPDGESANYYWLDPGGPAAAVLALMGDDIVLVEQYRPRLGTTVLGPPGGAVDPGEDPATAAARELEEETGYVATDLTYVDSYVPTPWTRYTRHLFATTALEPGESDLDDGEYIDVRRVPADDAIDRLRSRDGPANGIGLTPLLLAREDGWL
jgi:ADP-ribose pyrophosphatase